MPAATPPAWHQTFNTSDHVRWFWSKPTLEPTLVAGNETLVTEALKRIAKDLGESPTPANVDAFFDKKSNRKYKGEFAFELAALADANLSTLVVPDQLKDLFDWLWGGHAPEPVRDPVDLAAPVTEPIAAQEEAVQEEAIREEGGGEDARGGES
jgi:putative ATP-dependent endonuclease of OLD family